MSNISADALAQCLFRNDVKKWGTHLDTFYMGSWSCKTINVILWLSLNPAMISLTVMWLSERTRVSFLASLLASSTMDSLPLIGSSWTMLCLIGKRLIQCFSVIYMVDNLINYKHLIMNLLCCFVCRCTNLIAQQISILSMMLFIHNWPIFYPISLLHANLHMTCICREC